ncbi:DUF4192 domain-containing protein [Alloactinosynnema sp. L-07]|uniref:DUF4192 domain-containing protein n=1 Tax=Alloactinosynnema sp. L-07 TaxID=1653480 RepID=UPI001E2D3571|nr:DUF4192 domain-containing protein [Alloactinosynnema sp. L-07]
MLSQAGSSDTAASILIEEPGEFIASIPALLGFTPSNSLVLHVIDGPTLRVDLPGIAGHSGFTRHAADVVSRHGRQVILTAIGGDEDDTTMPLRELIDRLIRDLHDAGVETAGAWRVFAIAEGERWTCLVGDCHGFLPDPAATPVAAARELHGLQPYPSIAELDAALAQDPMEDLERRARRITVLRQVAACADRCHELITATIEAISAGASAEDLDDDTLVRIGCALTGPGVLGQWLLDLASEEARTQSAVLWTRLVQAMPDGPERTGPALLLAVAQHLAGAGVQANRALRVAGTADPSNHLITLLSTAFQYGVTPRELHKILSRFTP